jgi:hypothetical protein
MGTEKEDKKERIDRLLIPEKWREALTVLLDGPKTGPEIAVAIGISGSGAYGMMAMLEAGNYVRAGHRKKNKNSYCINLTCIREP